MSKCYATTSKHFLIIQYSSMFLEYLDLHCWVQGTYTLRSVSALEGIRSDFAHSGKRPMADHSTTEEIRDQNYYKWVSIVLFFQALTVYLPRYIWKNLEDGKIRMLIQDLNVRIIKQTNRYFKIFCVIFNSSYIKCQYFFQFLFKITYTLHKCSSTIKKQYNSSLTFWRT
jgi:hypothetical protein